MSRSAATLLTVALCLLPAAPAGAQEPESAAGEGAPRLTVESFTGVLAGDQSFRIAVRVDNDTQAPADNLRLLVSLHRRVFSRFEYQQAVDEGSVGNLWTSAATDVPTVAPDTAARVTVQRSPADLGFADPSGDYGVYPMHVQLLQSGEIVDDVHTSLVVVAEQVQRPLRSSLVVPLDAPPGLTAEGAYDAAFPLQLQPGQRLAKLVSELGQGPQTPATVATSGLLLDQARDLADGFQVAGSDQQVVDVDPLATDAAAFLTGVRDLVEQPSVEQLALPFGPADLVALVRGGMAGEAARHINGGAQVVEDLTGVAPQERILVPPDGLDSDTVDTAVGQTASRAVVLGEGFLDIVDGRELISTPSPVRPSRTGTGTTLDVLVPDPWISQVLRRDQHPDGLAIATQRVVAETATLYFERPNAQEMRGVVLAPPPLWDPPDGFLSSLRSRMSDAPWLTPVTLSTLEASVTPTAEPVRLDYPVDARIRELSGSYVARVAESRRDLASLSTILPDRDQTPADYDRLLRVAASVHYRDRPAEGLELMDAVSSRAAQLYESVQVLSSAPVTLTSLEGAIPVTLRSQADVPLRVRVQLQTNVYTFENPGGQEFVIAPEETITVPFSARALVPGGTSPVTVLVTAPDGDATLAQGTVVVRSTAVSTAALIITVGAGLFLLAWWLLDWFRRRRARADVDVDEQVAAA